MTPIGFFNRLAPILCLLGLLSCAREEPFLAGYLQRLSDGVLTDCQPYAESGIHSCLLLLSTAQKRLFVYDASAKELILAPNSYFPLRTPMGPATTKLIPVANEKNAAFVFGLDSVKKALIPIPLRFDRPKHLESFSPMPDIMLAETPTDAAIIKTPNFWLALIVQRNSKLALWPIDPNTAQPIATEPSRTLDLSTSGTFSQIAVDQEGLLALLSDENADKILSLDLTGIYDDAGVTFKKRKEFDTGSKVGRVVVQKRLINNVTKTCAFILGKDDKKITLMDIGKPAMEKLAEHTLTFLPLIPYASEVGSTCCQGKKDWVSIIDEKGKLHYVLIEPGAAGAALGFVFKESESIDLSSAKALEAKNLLPTAMVGGKVRSFSGALSEGECENKVFLLFGYSRNRYSFVEDEAHGWGCEGQSSFVRLGSSLE